MKGLIIKDFKMMKHDSIIGIMIPTLFFIISLFGGNIMFFTVMSVMMFALIPTLNIANDEKYKWNKYEAILPIKREHIVLEKYILLLIFIIPIIVAEALIIYFIKNYSINEMLTIISSMLFFGLITPSIVLPLYFLFGYNTGRMAGVPVSAVIYIVFTAISMKNNTTDSIVKSEFICNANTPLIFSLGLIFICISIILSIIIYKRKEF